MVEVPDHGARKFGRSQPVGSLKESGGGLPAPVWKDRNAVSRQGPIARRLEQEVNMFQGYFAAVVKKSLTDT